MLTCFRVYNITLCDITVIVCHGWKELTLGCIFVKLSQDFVLRRPAKVSNGQELLRNQTFEQHKINSNAVQIYNKRTAGLNTVTYVIYYSF